MEYSKFKKIIVEQNESFLKENIIRRDLLDKILEFHNDSLITIITGIRRCGKSTILSHLREEFDGYYVNFEDERLIEFRLKDFDLLLEILHELFGEKNLFFFDEIQNISGWERFVRRLHDKKNKIYITGSNASLLSKELGTKLTGRHIELTLFPFSFNEFLLIKNELPMKKNVTGKERGKIKRYFNEYVDNGGFPEYLKNGKKEYLQSLYYSIIYRDILARYNPAEKTLKEVVYYSASNLGKETSFNQLKKLTGLTSATTVKQYFDYLENSFLCFLVNRYDNSLKKQTYYPKKIYFIDTAISKTVGFRSSEDYGRMLENIIFLHLKKNGFQVFYFKGKKECDFVIKDGFKITKAIQVCQSIENNKTFEREKEGLIEAIEKYNLKEGLLLTENEEKEILIKNKKIKIIPIWKWLLEN